jgi:CheY-like chemotaxis protein
MTSTCVIGESDPFVALLLQRFAEKCGLQVVRATVGQDVLELVKQIEPVVVILDAELPGHKRGWEIVEALRNDPLTSATPLISCSWVSEAKAIELMGTLAGHLQKPELHLEDFLIALGQAGVQIDSPPASKQIEKK